MTEEASSDVIAAIAWANDAQHALGPSITPILKDGRDVVFIAYLFDLLTVDGAAKTILSIGPVDTDRLLRLATDMSRQSDPDRDTPLSTAEQVFQRMSGKIIRLANALKNAR